MIRQKMDMVVKWKRYFIESVCITKGTQRGQALHHFFSTLNSLLSGITIYGTNCNAFWHVHDVFLTNGLQKMIDFANHYIS